MLNLNRFIEENVTCRHGSMFAADIEANAEALRSEIGGRSVCVIGGAGSIGSSFIRALLPFRPASLVVVDINENGLAELTRSLRSEAGLYVPGDYRTYTLNYADPIFRHIFLEDRGFDIVANFSAHKHVRSEKDRYSVQALLENNDIKAKGLMDLLAIYPPRHFFCVSTDKAANPVNIMGASKRLMEQMVMAYRHTFKVTTARFANVAFSNGSLPDGWLHRLMMRQPLAAPADVLRYFVSPEESGQICLLACILGRSGEVFFPKLGQEQMKRFSDICLRLVKSLGAQPALCSSEEQAQNLAAAHLQGTVPVLLTVSDTSGEKPYEEFFTPGENVDADRFEALSVIAPQPGRPIEEISDFFGRLEAIFASDDFTKEQVVTALSEFLPDFHHSETGRNLDQKM